jgi:hypothetical protein
MLQPVATGELNSPYRQGMLTPVGQDEQSGGVDAYGWGVEDPDADKTVGDDSTGYRSAGDLDEHPTAQGRKNTLRVGPRSDEVPDSDAAYKEFDFDPDASPYLLYGLHPIATRYAQRIVDETKADAIAAGRRDDFPHGAAGEIPVDAVRHALWSYRIAKKHGASAAKDILDAHELRVPSQHGDRLMDLFNNMIGRQLAANKDNHGRPDIDVIMEALKKGKLRLKYYNAR